MDYFELTLCGLKRNLPVVSIGPKLKIASFNLLGDGELVENIAQEMKRQIEKKGMEFDYLVGPEVKVVPLIQSLAFHLNKPRYVILRKNIMGYMTRPVVNSSKPTLVLNGNDADLLKGKRVLIIDDVVSTGKTIKNVNEIMNIVGATVVGAIAVLKQGDENYELETPFISLGNLPVIRKS